MIKRYPAYWNRGALAFTLVELMVAITILTVLVLLIAQILNTTSQTTSLGINQLNNMESGRQALDRIGLDLTSSLRDVDIPHRFICPTTPTGDDEMQFYSEVSSLSAAANTRELTFVDYRTTAADGTTAQYQLNRGVIQTLAPAFGVPITAVPTGIIYQPIATGIVRFKLAFLPLNTGTITTTPPATPGNLGAVIVTIVVIDNTINPSSSDLQTLAGKFLNPTTGDFYHVWNLELTSLSSGGSGLSPRLINATHIYQRFYYVR